MRHYAYLINIDARVLCRLASPSDPGHQAVDCGHDLLDDSLTLGEVRDEQETSELLLLKVLLYLVDLVLHVAGLGPRRAGYMVAWTLVRVLTDDLALAHPNVWKRLCAQISGGDGG